jgi:hypothetical protein
MTKLDDAIDAAIRADDLQEVQALLERARVEDPLAYVNAYGRMVREYGDDAAREKLRDLIRHLMPSTAMH